jgi:mono/diheme cytochrome c family protein
MNDRMRMSQSGSPTSLGRLASCALLLSIGSTALLAQSAQQPIPPLPRDMLADAAKIATGKAVWEEQCTHCHGRNAYPGKAPKLEPGRYSPEFVYHRVTYGFRGMPPFAEVYDEQQRIGVIAYVLSPSFSP